MKISHQMPEIMNSHTTLVGMGQPCYTVLQRTNHEVHMSVRAGVTQW